jgi:hypothetical protein
MGWIVCHDLTNNNQLIEITTLFERKSAKTGNIYLVGRLGAAKILLLPGDNTPDGQATWRVLLGEATPKSAVVKPQPRPSSQARSRVRRPAAPSAAGPPLPDDDISDLWSH